MPKECYPGVVGSLGSFVVEKSLVYFFDRILWDSHYMILIRMVN